MLKLEGVTQRYGGFCALRDVSFQMADRSVTGLIGPNGAGKTTLLNGVTGLNPLTAGSVKLDGTELRGLRPDKIARMGVGRTFQNLRLFQNLTVLEHLTAAQSCRLGAAEQLFPSRAAERRRREEAYGILEYLGIARFAGEYAPELSYGDCRRVELARALAASPRLLLLDEPGAGMNEEESAEIAEQILGIQEKFSLMILLIEHDMSIIRRCCRQVVVLSGGVKLAEGSFEEIAANEEVKKAYLGEDDDASGIA